METGKIDPAKQAKGLLDLIGGMAEMSHHFYLAMIHCGASPREATDGMQAFIHAQWSEAMNAARKQNEMSQNEN